MASLIQALDKHTPRQVGENGHVEHGWSHDIDEKIVQFFFQLVRCNIIMIWSASIVRFFT